MERKLSARKLEGTIQIPASKSDAQRAVLAAALTNGRSTIVNTGNSDDVLSMIGAISRLGAVTGYERDDLIINGFTSPNDIHEIYVGESGLALRLLCSICSALGGEYHFTGKGTLNERDHSFFEDQLSSYGIEVSSENGHLPLTINGKLQSGDYKVDGSSSSQFISGLLMALPLLDGDSVLTVKELKSSPYVEMTLRTLDIFGIEIDHDDLSEFRIKGGQQYGSTQYYVEADWSSASYWIVAAAIGNNLKIQGLNMRSHQADRRILEALEKAGCVVKHEHDILEIDGSSRRSFSFNATDCPDLFPALVTLAAFCDGVSEIKGVGRLENKESNRGKVLQCEFGKLGLTIDLSGDLMLVHGGSSLHGGTVDSHGDHRIAMCLGIAATQINDEVVIDGSEAVGKSYPDFWKDQDLLTR